MFDACKIKISSACVGVATLFREGAFHIIGGSFLQKLAAFLGSVILVRIISKGDFGLLSYMENLYSYAYIIAGLGLNNALIRYLVKKEEREDKAAVFRFVLLWGTIINVAIFIVLSIVFSLYPHQAEFSFAKYYLPILLLALPFQYLLDTDLFALRGLFQNKIFAKYSVFGVCLIWSLKALGAISLGLLGAIVSWPLSYCACSLFLLFLIKRRLLPEKASSIPGAEKKEIWVYSLQFMVTNGLWALFMQNDILFIGLLTGSSESVAIYKVAYVIPAAMSILSSSIGTFVAPYFVRHENDYSWVWSHYLKVLLASVVLLGSASVLLYQFGGAIVVLIYGSQYNEAGSIMQLLLIAVFLNNAIRYTAAHLMSAMGKAHVNLIVSAFGVVLQIVADLLLIPVYGVAGAAYASITVYAIMALAATICFLRLYGPLQKKRNA